MSETKLPPALLYEGSVAHSRFGTTPHRLKYRLFLALLDIDALDKIAERVWCFSHNRFNLFAFHDTDHGPKTVGGQRALRPWVEAQLRDAGLTFSGGSIRLLSLPRILGFAFNPLSVYFCYRADQSLAALLYEVNNTFGERHTYVIPMSADDVNEPVRQRCEKRFYVSPFLDMAMTYDFRIGPPGATVSVSVTGWQNDKRKIVASFFGNARPFDDRSLISAFVRRPHAALMVVAGIYWEAFKLWRKGIGLRARPTPPISSTTLVLHREGEG
jgi:DUF1365 family protein